MYKEKIDHMTLNSDKILVISQMMITVINFIYVILENYTLAVS